MLFLLCLYSYHYAAAGAQRIAMRQGSVEMQFLAGNHLGSTETVFSAAGTISASMRYNPFAGTRYTSAGSRVRTKIQNSRRSAKSGGSYSTLAGRLIF